MRRSLPTGGCRAKKNVANNCTLMSCKLRSRSECEMSAVPCDTDPATAFCTRCQNTANLQQMFCTQILDNEGKGKTVPLQAWSGPEGSRKLRFPDFMTTAQDGGKVVSLTHRPLLPPGNTPGTHFC